MVHGHPATPACTTARIPRASGTGSLRVVQRGPAGLVYVVARGVDGRDLSCSPPLHPLAQGWRDLRRVGTSLTYHSAAWGSSFPVGLGGNASCVMPPGDLGSGYPGGVFMCGGWCGRGGAVPPLYMREEAPRHGCGVGPLFCCDVLRDTPLCRSNRVDGRGYPVGGGPPGVSIALFTVSIGWKPLETPTCAGPLWWVLRLLGWNPRPVGSWARRLVEQRAQLP